MDESSRFLGGSAKTLAAQLCYWVPGSVGLTRAPCNTSVLLDPPRGLPALVGWTGVSYLAGLDWDADVLVSAAD